MRKVVRYYTAVLLGIIFFLPVKLNSQNLDSLENLLIGKKLSVADEIRIYDDLSWFYQNSNMRKAVDHGLAGLKLAQREGDKQMEATFYRNIGVAYYMASMNDSAKINLDQSLRIVEKINDTNLAAALNVAYGNISRVQSRYNDALRHYLKAAEILEQRKESHRLGAVYLNIGGIYQIMRNFNQALGYFEKAKVIAEETGNSELLADIYVSLSDRELYHGEVKAQSLYYGEEALKIYKEIGNTYKEYYTLLLLSKVYYHHQDYTKAFALAQEVLEKTKNLGFPTLASNAYIHISNIHYRQGRYAESAEAAKQALEVDTTDTNITKNAYSNLLRSNAFLGKPALTEHFLERYGEALDKFSNKEFQNSLSEMEVKYETEKKELRINSLEKERVLYGIIFGVSFLGIAILLGALYLRQRAKKQLAEQKVIQLEQEKQLVATQAVLDGETAERTRLARDLHDGLGGMLSAVKLNLFDMKNGVIIEAEDVLRFNKVMDMLDNSMQELRRVAHNMMPESLSRYGLKVALEDFCNNIRHVNFHFFGEDKRLEQKMEATLYRAVIELVNNAIKHSEAETINVQLVQQPESISINVQDDGKGFDLNEETKGTGLINIKNRIKSAGGTIDVFSSTGKGTEVAIEMNVKQT